MASRTLVRWWGWATGKPPRAEVMRKWLYTEDAPEVYPLVAATSFGAIMAVSAMAYQLIYNPSILLNKDDRTLEMPEDPAIGAAFQQHKLRRWLKKHYSEEGTDHVRPVRTCTSCSLQFLLPFKWLNTHIGGLGNAPGAEVPHEHFVAGMPEEEWEKRVEEGAKRHLRLLRQPNVDPADSLIRDTRPIWQQLLHRGDPADHRHPHDAKLLYHPHPADDESKH